jgi:predicted O-methyltransferase YrrM
VDPKTTLEKIAARAAAVGFVAAAASQVGEFLTALAASKPGGQILELGTGTGLGTACLLLGMDSTARLITVELDPALSAIAQAELRDDRVEWVVGDGGDWLSATSQTFDLVFADTWPGKFTHLDRTLALVNPGGLYVIDDLRPQPNWPQDHQAAVDDLLANLRVRPGWVTAYFHEASGVLLCVRT